MTAMSFLVPSMVYINSNCFPNTSTLLSVGLELCKLQLTDKHLQGETTCRERPLELPCGSSSHIALVSCVQIISSQWHEAAAHTCGLGYTQKSGF